MPEVRQYPEATFLLPTDAFVIDRLGIGTMFIEAQNAFEGSYDVAMGFPPVPPANQVILEFVAVRPFVIPSVSNPSPPPAPIPVQSRFYAHTPPSGGSVTLIVAKNGGGVGTIVFGDGDGFATYTWLNDVTFAAGDILLVTSPLTVFGIGGLALTFAGYRL